MNEIGRLDEGGKLKEVSRRPEAVEATIAKSVNEAIGRSMTISKTLTVKVHDIATNGLPPNAPPPPNAWSLSLTAALT